MTCTNCGKEIMDGVKFCPECGKPVSDASAEIVAGEFAEERNSAGNMAESMRNKVGSLRKFNIGHLGVFLGGILAIASVFKENVSGIYNSGSVVSNINNNPGLGFSGNSIVFIMIACILVTFLMALFRRYIPTIIGAVVSFGIIIFMSRSTGQSVLAGMGYTLFVVGGIILVVSAIGSFLIYNRHRSVQ